MPGESGMLSVCFKVSALQFDVADDMLDQSPNIVCSHLANFEDLFMIGRFLAVFTENPFDSFLLHVAFHCSLCIKVVLDHNFVGNETDGEYSKAGLPRSDDFCHCRHAHTISSSLTQEFALCSGFIRRTRYVGVDA